MLVMRHWFPTPTARERQRILCAILLLAPLRRGAFAGYDTLDAGWSVIAGRDCAYAHHWLDAGRRGAGASAAVFRGSRRLLLAFGVSTRSAKLPAALAGSV